MKLFITGFILVASAQPVLSADADRKNVKNRLEKKYKPTSKQRFLKYGQEQDELEREIDDLNTQKLCTRLFCCRNRHIIKRLEEAEAELAIVQKLRQDLRPSMSDDNIL